jgi:hypothetical protein
MFPKFKRDDYMAITMRTTAGEEVSWSKLRTSEIKCPVINTAPDENSKLSRGITSYSPLRTYRKITNENKADNIFAISNEDKIFDDEKLKCSVEFIRNLREKKTVKTALKDKSQNGNFSLNAEVLDRIKKARRQKHLELDVYHKTLVKSLHGAIRTDNLKLFESKLLDLRIKYYKVPKVESMNSIYTLIKKEDTKTIMTLRKSYEAVTKYKNKLKKKGIDIIML